MGTRSTPAGIDEYIATSRPEVRPILRKIRSTIRSAAPDAEETISYGIPAFRQNAMLVYFAAFRGHIGIFPPISGDLALEKALAPYAGEKGNLRFPLDRPIPYRLIRRIVRVRVKQDLAHGSRRKRGGTSAVARRRVRRSASARPARKERSA